MYATRTYFFYIIIYTIKHSAILEFVECLELLFLNINYMNLNFIQDHNLSTLVRYTGILCNTTVLVAVGPLSFHIPYYNRK